MGSSSTLRKTLLVGLTVLILLQLVALPLHEWLLSQQGYTLIHHRPGEQPGKATVPVRIAPVPDTDFYNIAGCFYHFRIQALFLILGLGMIPFIQNFVAGGSHSNVHEQRLTTLRYGLSSIVSRAPPA